MNSAENKRSVMVGVFVLLALIIFVAGVFILGGQQNRFESSIRVRAVFDDVEGLRTGNNVWFSGVKIGTVKRISFYGEDQVEVEMNIIEDAQRYIHKDARALLSSESLIGNRIIEITGGSPQAPPVQDGDIIQVEAGLDTDDMLATLQRNNENLVSITEDFKELSAGLTNGKGTVGALLTDSTLANNLRTMVTNLQQTSANSARASQALTQFTSKLNTPGGLANELLTDTAVFNKLQASVAQLEQATTSASAMVENLNQATGKLNDSDNAVGVLLSDPDFAKRLQSTMQNLETSTEKFDQNMEALQHNFLLRGFFKRQAQQQNTEQEQQ
ncbi:MlaD family protein [Pontibacter silvestris]|uniref:MlaD family protein n=1 Tax=Pontibacter silvestris TaxID=2305183 RepID=A0ABW4WZU4_9BACT|nr:MlaD family protein [Pontibacter silvestris]MCC9137495.1 MlaD family protein [Pontibacter silvestris]